jgi:hypothetical protein
VEPEGLLAGDGLKGRGGAGLVALRGEEGDGPAVVGLRASLGEGLAEEVPVVVVDGRGPGTVTLTGGRPKRSDFAERRCQAIALALVTSRQPAKAVSRAARRSIAVVDSG